MDTRTEGLNTA